MMIPWFEETQRMRDNVWILWMCGILLILPLPLVYYGLFEQLVIGQPWGNDPMSDTGLIAFSGFITIVSLGVLYMITSFQLETRIDREGIHYRLLPIVRSWKLIVREEIAEYHFEDKFKPFEGGGGVGRHRNIFKRLTTYRMYSRKHIDIKKKDGQRILLGTINKEGMAMAIRKLMDKTDAG